MSGFVIIQNSHSTEVLIKTQHYPALKYILVWQSHWLDADWSLTDMKYKYLYSLTYIISSEYKSLNKLAALRILLPILSGMLI